MTKWHWVLAGPALFLLALARIYQLTLSPIIGRQCRFHPTCSQYFMLAVLKHGVLKGLWRGVARVGRCHPWHSGGFDWP